MKKEEEDEKEKAFMTKTFKGFKKNSTILKLKEGIKSMIKEAKACI